jgi:hypothetical protein
VPLQDWIDVPALKRQSKHTTAVAGVLVSLFIISHLANWLFGKGGLVPYLAYLDDFLTIVAVLFYGGRMVYHILREGKVNGNGNGRLVLVA